MLENGGAVPFKVVHQGSEEKRRKIGMRKKIVMLDEDAVRKELRRHIDAEHGSQAAFAKVAKVPANFVTMVLNGSRRPSPAILKRLGLRRVVRYERCSPK